MPESIKVSAIIPNYNCAKLLPKSIQSLLDQTEPFTEILIIDDASTDNSLEVIQQLQEQHSHIRLVRNEVNQGVCKSLNKALQQANGDYILFGAADDWYGQECVATVKRAVSKFPQVGVICGDAIVHYENKDDTFHRMMCFSKIEDFISPEELKRISKKDYIGFTGGGLFLNRIAALEAQGLYVETAWYSDWLLYFAVAFRQGVYYAQETFIHTLQRQNSYSAARHDWQKEKPVFMNLMRVMHDQFPDLWPTLKNGALLPHYELRYLTLLPIFPVWRDYMSLRLLWRLLLTNPLFVRLGQHFPYRFVLFARRLLRA